MVFPDSKFSLQQKLLPVVRYSEQDVMYKENKAID